MIRLLFALLLIAKVVLFVVAATVGMIFGYVRSMGQALAWLVRSIIKIITGDLE